MWSQIFVVLKDREEECRDLLTGQALQVRTYLAVSSGKRSRNP